MFLFIALNLCVSAKSQDANNLALDATVKDLNGGRLAGADIVVIQDGALVDKVKTRKNGRFDLLLDFDHEYIIEANKPGYVSKRMYVNTNNVPEDEQLWGYEYGGFAIDLFKMIEGVDFTILDKPVAKIYYDPNAQNFTYDKTYTKQIKSELDDLLDEYERKEKMQEQILKQNQEDFELAMRDAQNALEDGDYLVAKENYLAAASLNPNSSEPQKKLEEIESKINAEANKDEKYMSVLASADQLYAKEKFVEAKAKYEEAKKIKPNESYPQDRIKASEKAAAEKKQKEEEEALLAEKDRKYNEQIKLGDEEFTSGNYLNAKTYYQNALGHKDEDYPKNQIAAADIKIRELKESQEQEAELALLTEKYKAEIAKADAAFKSESYENALAGYGRAKSIKPDESYPDDQIKLIEEAIENKKREETAALEAQKKEAEYKKLISEADGYYNRKQFEEAKSKYALALEQNSDDDYPKLQLQKIENELKALKEEERLEQEKRATQQAYNDAIAKADASFKNGSLIKARSEYEIAANIDSSQDYPKQKIQEIDSKLENQEVEKKYQDLISSADVSFNSKNYEEARSLYSQALEVMPSEVYPTNQLKEIDQRIAQERDQEKLAQERAEREAKYAELIESADKLFKDEDYESAISKYESAKSYTDNSKYANDQIKAARTRQKEKELANKELAELKRIQSAYEEKISQADAFFESENLEKALETYNAAASIDQTQNYPKTQISKIESLIEEQKLAAKAEEEERLESEREAAKRQEYQDLVAQADGYMDSEDYLKARSLYKQAAEIDNTEDYPRIQLDAISQILQKMKETADAEEAQRKAYNDLLSKGDKAVIEKRWDDARTAFKEALEIYPNEKIPTSRLSEIDELEERQREERTTKEFNSLVKEADELFLNQSWDEAEAKYKSALELRDDAHSKSRLAKINELRERNTEETVVESEVKRNVSEENFKEGNAQVTVRTVTEGEKVDIYKRVVHSWGGKYYFLNDQPISELVWNRDSQ